MNATNQTATVLDLKQAKVDAVRNLLRPHGNIVGIGIGKKVKDGKETGEDCLRFYVISKIKDTGTLPGKDVLPGDVPVLTDVIEVGRFGRSGHPPKPTPSTLPRPGARIRVKTNAPNVNEGARGTIGAVVTDGKDHYILGCNHLLAVNGRVPKDAALVSAEFVGQEKTIARNMTYSYIKLYGDQNTIDCAIVPLPQPNHQVQTTFPDGGRLSSPALITPDIGMRVTKFGPITGRTRGTIVDTQVDLYVDYAFGTFLFREQVMIDGGDTPDYFAAAGDSGSLVVDEQTGQAMAMIFAASGRFAVACPMEAVLKQLASEAKLPYLELVV
jgi:hypothetical protein